MKRIGLVITVLALTFLICGIAEAAYTGQSQSLTVSATAPLIQTFSVKTYRVDSKGTQTPTDDVINWGAPQTSMAFGDLVNSITGDPTSALQSKDYFLVLIGVTNNSGKPYYITYNGAPLRHTDGTTTLSNDAWIMSTDNHYDTSGNAIAFPTGTQPALYKTNGTASQTNLRLYNSTSTGSSVQFRVYFGVTGDPAQAVGNKNLIPPNQKTGTYSATVTFTITE